MEDKEDDFESEEPRMKDQEESSQLERNIRERDAARTQKLMEPKLTDEEEEELIQRYVAFEKDDSSDLRKVSRQVYLQKRRDQKLLEIRDVIIDHEYIFEGVKLTEAEEQELSWIKKFASWRRTLCIEVSQLERNHRMPDDSTFSWHVVKCRCCIDLFTTHEEFSSFHFFLFLFVKFTCLIVKVSVVQQSNY
ncbi:pre-mRNA-splicing factor ATP-dependent RNA helicase DEAH1-like [Typha latifolia]|uniref:pre-mRNA-splicing factor ATP-dependent RNA helicase DEAH1-like n=1 Tax=Typha latifolia TaxID=4733 RepID=UPI003C2FD64B